MKQNPNLGNDGSRILAVTDEQKIQKLGELHAVMCKKVEEAQVAVEAWNKARQEMPYMYQPRIPSMLVWGTR